MDEEDKLNQNEIKSSASQINLTESTQSVVEMPTNPEVLKPSVTESTPDLSKSTESFTENVSNSSGTSTIFVGPADQKTEGIPEVEPSNSKTDISISQLEQSSKSDEDHKKEAEVILDKRLVEGKDPFYLIKWKNEEE